MAIEFRELRIREMSCVHCDGSSTSAVSPLPDVTAVDIDRTA